MRILQFAVGFCWIWVGHSVFLSKLKSSFKKIYNFLNWIIFCIILSQLYIHIYILYCEFVALWYFVMHKLYEMCKKIKIKMQNACKETSIRLVSCKVKSLLNHIISPNNKNHSSPKSEPNLQQHDLQVWTHVVFNFHPKKERGKMLARQNTCQF